MAPTAATIDVTPSPAKKRRRLPAIFVSYRRADSEGVVIRLASELRRRFGDYQVFHDTQQGEEHLGENYKRLMRDALASCDAILVIIGKTYLIPRLLEPDDPVRLEVTTGLKRGETHVLVIPILVNGAEQIAAASLPDGMRELPDREWCQLRDLHWDADLEILCRRLQKVVGKRDKGAIGALSLAWPAAVSAAVALVGWRAAAPMLRPHTQLVAASFVALAGLVAGTAGWYGLSGTWRWLATLSRTARHWSAIALQVAALLLLAVGYERLRPLTVTIVGADARERPSACQPGNIIQPYQFVGRDQAGRVFEPPNGARPCEVRFTGAYQTTTIRTGIVPRIGEGTINVRVSGGSIAAVLFPSRQKRPDDGLQQNIPYKKKTELNFAVADLRSADRFVGWFTLASEEKRACATVSVSTKGGEVLGSDERCVDIP